MEQRNSKIWRLNRVEFDLSYICASKYIVHRGCGDLIVIGNQLPSILFCLPQWAAFIIWSKMITPAPAIASAFQPGGKGKRKGSTPSLPFHWLGPSCKPHLTAKETGKYSPWWRVLYSSKTFITIKEEDKYRGTLWS